MKTFEMAKRFMWSLILLQVMGLVWSGSAVQAQLDDSRPERPTALIAGLKGEVTVTPFQNGKEGHVPQFRSPLREGDLITTGEESVVEVLALGHGLVTLQELTEAMVTAQEGGNLQVTVNVGVAEISSPLQGKQGNSALILRTPYTKARTLGGLVTVEVQSTIDGAVFRPDSQPGSAFLVRTKYPSTFNPPANLRILERYCVMEGELDVQPLATAGGVEKVKLEAGECSRFTNGKRQPLGTLAEIIDWRSVCVVGHHCDIPDGANELIAKKQMGQALALERALTGSETEDGEVDEQVILATTGGLLASANNGQGPSLGPGDGIILPCTGNSQDCAAPDLNLGGTPPPIAGGGGGGDTPVPGNVQTIGVLLPEGLPGGPGLLTFLESNFMVGTPLIESDSGFRAGAPHLGTAPQNTLVVSGLTPNSPIPSNENIPLFFESFNLVLSAPVQLGTESGDREDQAQQLSQFARSSGINPNNILASVPEGGAAEPCQALIECFEIILALGKQGTFDNPDPDGGIDGAIVVRSSSTFDPFLGFPGASREVTLKSGVVIANSVVGVPEGMSFISVKGVPGEPAILSIEDRALAILEGSAIQPVGPIPGDTRSLVSIMDGTLHGPDESPTIGTDGSGAPIIRPDIPPLIEIIDSDVQIDAGFILSSSATSSQTGPLDQALLNASAPLLGMLQSTFASAGDFGTISGQNAKLLANLDLGDALVRVDASSFMVNGNLFTVTGGGQLMLNGGSLLSVTGNGNATIQGGVLVSVGADSIFSLAGGATLVDFGRGINNVNISNNLCNGGGCFAPFDNPAWQVAGDAANFSAPPGYTPFLDVGTFSDGSVNTLNITEGSAVLEVQSGGTIQIQ